MGGAIFFVFTISLCASLAINTDDSSAVPHGATIHKRAAVVYDNGGLNTNIGLSEVQLSLGLSTFGFGAQCNFPSPVADDFTLTNPTQITAMEFFAFQTGSSTVSTITAINVQIVTGTPNLPTSIVFGDLDTNVLASTSWTGLYRVDTVAPSLTNRPIMSVVANVNVSLPPGTYWVKWCLKGSLSSGPWAPPVTILGSGQKPGSNSMHKVGSQDWTFMVDANSGVRQDLPFRIQGTETGGTVAPATTTDSPISTTTTWTTTAPPSECIRADVNCDGQVNLMDLVQVLDSWSI